MKWVEDFDGEKITKKSSETSSKVLLTVLD